MGFEVSIGQRDPVRSECQGESAVPGWRQAERSLNELKYFERTWKNKGKVTQYRVGIPTSLGIAFKLASENSLDVMFKALGLSREFQTGDAAFDRAIYIACDHFAFTDAIGRGEASRAHPLACERDSLVLLLISVPILSLQLVSDLNRKLDHSRPIVIEAAVADKWQTTHRSRRKTNTRYHVRWDLKNASGAKEGVHLPERLDVSYELQESLDPSGGKVTIEVGKGWLEMPWYRRINGFPVGEW